GMMGGVGVGGGTPASVAQGGMHRANGGGVNTGGVDGSATPLGSSANGALNGTGGTTPPPSASVTGSTVTPSSAGQASPAHGNDDNLANDAGEEVALAAVERTLVNRTPKRPVKSSLPSLANAGFAPQRAPTTSTTADSSVAGSEDHRRVADGDTGAADLAALPAVRGSPTGGLVSAGDPLVSPSRFSSNKGRRGGGRSFRSRPPESSQGQMENHSSTVLGEGSHTSLG
ncbi:hypothetical protein Vretimale_16839, partial [Volvox reticuliferus]